MEIGSSKFFQFIKCVKLWAATLLIVILFVSPVLADQKESLFQKANEFYEQGQYAEAIQEYHKILEQGYESWALYYNLGNAYFKTKQIGLAILNYERARKLAPENENVAFNLQLANLSVVDKIISPPQFFISRLLSVFKNYFSLNQLSLIVLSLYLLLMTGWIAFILLKNRRVKRTVLYGLIPVGVLLITFVITLGIRIYEDARIKEAIILADKVNVMSSPGEDATEVFSLHEGVKVQIEEVSGNWVEIRLPDGKLGWVRMETLEEI